MTERIPAKPTIYFGTRFRSRVEARWAVFFDAIGREWIYEPSIPELDGIAYQPDFLLKKGDTWSIIEVKGSVGAAVQAQDRLKEIATKIDQRIVMLIGQPGEWHEGRLIGSGHTAIFLFPSGNQEWGEWAECDKCHEVAISLYGMPLCHREWEAGERLRRACGVVRDHSYEDPVA